MEEAMNQFISIAEKLRISPEETNASAERVRFLLKAKEENSVNEHIDKIYGEWETIASRLQKGRSMLDQKVEGKRLRDLTNLYSFLLSQLGLYDLVLKHSLSESHYQALKNQIITIMNE